ncbi:MAG: BT_3928 family protein [Lacibacter sp.]
MKKILTVIRWFTGILFIFSGLVKANDPLGLSYKMQEFFEAWGLTGFHDYTLMLSVLMNAFEIVAGVAVIIGWRMRMFSWLLLLLILFFTFLTGYAMFSGKIRTCGCFGDCLPLSPWQSFIKDLVLLLFIALIFYYSKHVKPLFVSGLFNGITIAGALVFSFVFQWYVLRYLPVVDCLPFKKGNDLVELRKMPADAIPDRFEYVFVYQKNGERKEFPMSALPDSTWQFVDRIQTLVEKGKNNEPLIKDFDLKSMSGEDVTESVLKQPGEYYLLFIKDVQGLSAQDAWVQELSQIASKHKVVLVTSQPEAIRALWNKNSILSNLPVYVCDVTAIKTAARALPTLYKMKGSIVLDKWSYADFDQIGSKL